MDVLMNMFEIEAYITSYMVEIKKHIMRLASGWKSKTIEMVAKMANVCTQCTPSPTTYDPT